MRGTTVAMLIKIKENGSYLLDLERRSFSEQEPLMRCLFGENSSMIAGNRESTALSSETNLTTKAQNLSAKRMLSLMQSGLVAGITHTSTPKRLSHKTLDIVFIALDGITQE